MIIWSGHGYLVPVIVFLSCLAFQRVFDSLWGKGFYSSHRWAFAVALLPAAALVHVLGDRLRKRKSRTLIDKDTGEEIVIDRSTHTLFFLPMRHWGPLLAALALALLAYEFLKGR